ncbi:carbohydrate ABC transporter permease [Paenibacillus piri]|uniref:Carbohydrate ABC transporter permease n=1 Tax=Paenibacillus piri TaxID=2547395 RepID=A0A4R5KHA5_9BACL|nr:carbohydrate ABC transporter permease [Paenibacillus piri]TDF94105.1 carbohydrate ABC transporter permease [Paenibacillus piri]
MSFVHKKRLTLFDYINYLLLGLISLLCVFPFIYVFSVSLTHPDAYIPFTFYLFPEQFSLASYKYILSTNTFLDALRSTALITGIGTVLNLIFTFTFAYALSKKHMLGRKLMLGCVVFTLLFNAGIIPNYLLVKELGLLNSYWALIWPTLTNAWSLIVVKSFMDSIPEELEDAARIDGCNDLFVFLRIILPVSMPALAAFTLFFAVAHWNTYFNALIYLTDAKKWTLQVLIKTLVVDSDSAGVAQAGAAEDKIIPEETIRMAAVVLAMLPILAVYPFLQKYFAKGVMLGSIKG